MENKENRSQEKNGITGISVRCSPSMQHAGESCASSDCRGPSTGYSAAVLLHWVYLRFAVFFSHYLTDVLKFTTFKPFFNDSFFKEDFCTICSTVSASAPWRYFPFSLPSETCAGCWVL